MQTIEDIVLQYDSRNISKLRPYLPKESYLACSDFILKEKGTVFITTGFYVSGMAETDGPPGALAIAFALKTLGYNVILVGDIYCNRLWHEDLAEKFTIVNFPIMDAEKSYRFAEKLVMDFKPVLLISVERCGLNEDGSYCNMNRQDISAYTAKIDHLFQLHERSIGIGDGGNEIGMGNLKTEIDQLGELCQATVTETTHLLIASVSNWGAFGLVAAISEKINENLLVSVEQAWQWVRDFVQRGATAGMNSKISCSVDGYDEMVNSAILADLHAYVNQKIK